jgi:hypothetical protein
MPNLGVVVVILVALLPRPAQAQVDGMKGKLRELIEKSGIYVSTSTRTSVDNDVRMAPSIGVGYGTAGAKRAGVKFPFSYSGYRGGLETNAGAEFGEFKARQIMSGIGYQWVHGKMVYSTQLGLGYSFNDVTLNPGVALAFGVPEPVSVSVSNSFVVRPKVQAEYFLHHKVSVRTQLSYTYTDPDVVIHSAAQDFAREWRPHHVQVGLAMGFFPFRKR